MHVQTVRVRMTRMVLEGSYRYNRIRGEDVADRAWIVSRHVAICRRSKAREASQTRGYLILTHYNFNEKLSLT